ncbi:MAG: PQQ-binding-like beta-propeller repeat protein [Candidatus Omnitrophica bacterium]|nr:PQQ-binding-like beta-propeller repeat protein [Candidatus Omnitrophota bacterium]
MRKLAGVIYWLVLSLMMTIGSSAEDWPMWRYDAGRTAASPQTMTGELHLQWVREYPQPAPVWDDPLNQDLMQYDTVYEPIVLGGMMFVGFNGFDRLTAIDTDTGEEKWSFYAQGPVRLPPVAGRGMVYFVSDDGCLYCLDAETSDLQWKYQGVPQDRLILGNERLISTWCARGGPVLKDGIVYFGAGIWPFMGVFIFAIDAESGEEIWVNDGASAIFMKQPHNSPSFASVAPQGSLVISGDKLLVPGGRSVPACFDLKTGEFLYYRLADNGKTGGAFVSAIGDRFVNYYRDEVVNLFDLSTGDMLIGRFGKCPVLTPTAFYSRGEKVVAHDYANLRMIEKEKLERDRTTRELKVTIEKEWKLDAKWELGVDGAGDLIKAGDRLFAGGENVVAAIDLPSNDSNQPVVSWQAAIEGTASRLIAADDKLFVVTNHGKIYAFGAEEREPQQFPFETKAPALSDEVVEKAKSILELTSVREGYCFIYGVTNGDLMEALVRHSDLRVVAFDPDPQKVDALRRRFADAGLYGERLSIRVGDLLTDPTAPYIASLTLFEDLSASSYTKDCQFVTRLIHQTRPYGGMICLQLHDNDAIRVINSVKQCDPPNINIYQSDGYVQIVREGGLPGADDWSHQYGNIANTVKSDDQLVKLPLGLLWYGGSSNLDVLPRHGHGPPEQIVGGRLFIQGMNSLSARDVYTGRVLWKRTFPELDNYGVFYDETYQDTPLSTEYNQIHIPGANARGTNYVVAPDKIYLVIKNQCHVLDPVDGQTLQVIALPEFPHSGDVDEWGYIGVYEDYLIAGGGFASFSDFIDLSSDVEKKKRPFYNYDISSSKRLVVMNRHSGDVIWSFNADLGLRHNAIVAGSGKIFCIDKMPELVEKSLKRRGRNYIGTPRLLAFDIRNGNILWSMTDDVFGTWLSYSTEYDILIEAVRYSRDMLAEEPREKLAGFRGKDGEPLWKNDAAYGGPCILHGETIITEPFAFSLLTGEQKMRRNPLTGEKTPWTYNRQYGCNYSIASEYLMTFRSAAAGFFDLEQDAGTGNFGGFKSGCTSNLIAANGVLNAPDYTRTCSCSYQNQTSLALIHDPQVEIWTYNDIELGEGPIQRLGVNLGAPGDRRADKGTLWLEYPIVGGPSPEIEMQFEPSEPSWFRHHACRMMGGDLKWVCASGAEGLKRLRLSLAGENQGSMEYTVRLYFAEPRPIRKGDRVFDVVMQGRRALQDFDILNEVDSIRFGVVKEFHHVPVDSQLEIEFIPSHSSLIQESVLCGIELISSDGANLQAGLF